MTIWHVATHGCDQHPGTSTAPLATIQAAATRAQPGDTVEVHAGVYREAVDPPNGGSNDQQRVCFQAAEGEAVSIRGSELWGAWQPTNVAGVWQTRIANAFFAAHGVRNPFREVLWGDWFIDQGRPHHLADIFCNGVSLFEVASRAAVEHPQPWPLARAPEAACQCWWVDDADPDSVVVYANFGGRDPTSEMIEISVRPTVFFPSRTGVDYLTVRGFDLCHAANQWAPPTAMQEGLIGPHWAKGWIIEENIIHHARCVGISLGKERSTGHNGWSRFGRKHGSQREREVIFKALQNGWSRERVGSHIVRKNTIYSCEQAGIVGHLGCVFSQITHNHIHHIHEKRQFSGHEMGGIKFHAPIDTLIAHNYVHHCCRGMWMDWQTQGTRISRNLFHDNPFDDLYIEVAHGPYVVDRNILLSPVAIRNMSQGGLYAHNLIGGFVCQEPVLNRMTPYHLPHSTAVAGVMTIQGGDDRWLNNLFLPYRDAGTGEVDFADENDEAKQAAEAAGITIVETPGLPLERVYGLSVLNGYPVKGDAWCQGHSVADYAQHKFPNFFDGNYYADGAQPMAREEASVETGHTAPARAPTFPDVMTDLSTHLGAMRHHTATAQPPNDRPTTEHLLGQPLIVVIVRW